MSNQNTQNTLATISPELEKAVTETGLAIESAQTLKAAFSPHFIKFHELANSAQHVQADQPKAARAIRLGLKAVRVASEKTRKDLKEDSLRRGKAIDGINNLLEYQLVPVEQAMEKIEKAEELREAARIAALRSARELELAPFQSPEFFDLGNMPEPQWAQLLAGAKAAHQAKIDAEAKAEADRIAAAKAAEDARIAKEAAERAERERMKAENDRLAKIAAEERAAREAIEAKARAERVAAEAAAKIEREQVEAKRRALEEDMRKEREAAAVKAREEKAKADRLAAIERKKREDLESEIAAREAAEAKAKAESARLARIAAAAPERDRLLAYAEKISGIEIPSMTNDGRRRFIAAKASEFVDFIKSEAESLTK